MPELEISSLRFVWNLAIGIWCFASREISNPKHQIPNKLQAPMSKRVIYSLGHLVTGSRAANLRFSSSLRFVWSLGVGIWCFDSDQFVSVRDRYAQLCDLRFQLRDKRIELWHF